MLLAFKDLFTNCTFKVIDYLCIVGKLNDKGYNMVCVEEALLIFKNNSEKVCNLHNSGKLIFTNAY